MAQLRSGSIIQLSSGEILTVDHVRHTFETETRRYANDPNPTPAGSVAVKFEGPALDCRVLRPGSYRVIKR